MVCVCVRRWVFSRQHPLLLIAAQLPPWYSRGDSISCLRMWMFLLSHQGSSFRTSGGLLGLLHSLCPRHELGQERCKHRTFFNCLQPPRMGEMPLWSPAAAKPPTVGMGRLSEHGALPSAKHWACVSQPCRCCKGRDPGITPGSCSPLTLTFR